MSRTKQAAAPTTLAKADGFERKDHGERTRRRIIEAAVRLFSRRGFRGTGLAALAKEVGMSGPGLLYYFGSKERLLLDVVNERLVQERPDGDLALELADLAAAGRETKGRHPLSQLFLVLGVENIDEGEPLHDFFVERYRTNHELALRVLRHEQHAGRCRTDVDIDQVAAEMQAVTIGLELMWLTDPEHFDFQERIESYYQRLIDSIGPHRPTDGGTT